MLIKEAVVLALMILYLKCSKVIDENTQALYVSDYCPEIGTCIEGTHVMCMYYDPNRKTGPSCNSVQDFTMTSEIAGSLLHIMNGMRSRVARGLEHGKKKFPKAYGLFKLEWDPELATFAQLWANQCIYEKDLCRATKRFADPGQVTGAVLFTHPEWFPMGDKKKFKYQGFSLEKAKYALLNTLEFWYKSRKEIDPDIIFEKRKWPASLLDNRYLPIIQGSNTHVGCGALAYKKIRMNPGKKNAVIYNWVVLVCNFSTRLREEKLYNTKLPEGGEFTKKCGCPPGYAEDPDCLCYKIEKEKQINCKYGQSKAPVAVLPIFTIENAPPHKLIEKPRYTESKTKLRNQNELDLGLRLVKRFKPSLFSKSSVFVLPSRKLKVANTEIVNKDIRTLRNLSNFYNINEILSMERTYDKTNTKLDENNVLPKQLRLRKSSEINYNRNVDEKHNLNQYERKNNEELTEIRLPEQKLDANLTDKKTKYSPIKKTLHKDYNRFDYEQEKLYHFEDQIKTIKEYDDMEEPVNENENFATIYNTKKENAYRFKDRKNVNFVNIRNLHDLKDNTIYQINKNIDSISMEEDLMPLDKREYYQNKLNKLERKIRQMQNLNRRKYVEARRGDVIPMGLYGSSEKHLKGSQMNGHARESYEYEKAELPEFRKRKTKKKHNVIKKKKSHIKKSEAQDKQKFRRKGKKRDSKRFIKTTLKNIDKDSNLSDSEDNDKMTKPVDIIVHIKMKD
ncbi:unnamed protein product [Euphydryas editha]|uniref:SCP domain-containing protein n=1 Tax=Euphydryas editha TaxID=104508 RepID=A0AAU9UDN4_EUPED|nr:unnamed protein product [Euphydryas editha]